MENDPLRDFEHDHGRLTELVRGARDLIARAKQGDLSADEAQARLLLNLDQLQEELLTHFAREEEALFPFVRAHVPELTDAVVRLQEAHDAICGAVLRISYPGAVRGGSIATRIAHVATRFEQFEAAYAHHARAERELLGALASRLAEDQRRELRALTEGL